MSVMKRHFDNDALRQMEAGTHTAPSSSKGASRMASTMTHALRKHWFLFGLVSVIAMAQIYPWFGSDSGPLQPRITVKYGAVFAIFLISGITLKTEQLRGAFGNVKLNLFVQIFCMGVIPLLAKLVIAPFFSFIQLDPLLVQGILVVACMPPPVSTAVIIVKNIGGNEAAAIFNSVFGSILGIFITPLLLLSVFPDANRSDGQGDLLQSVFKELMGTVALPLFIGQVLRPFFSDHVDRFKQELGVVASLTLLLIIYTTFCNTFCGGVCTPSTFFSMEGAMSTLSTSSLLITGIGLCLIQLLLMFIILMITTHEIWGFSRADIVSILFSSVQKSLTLGVPMMKIVFSDASKISVITLPLLIYHPIQILLGGFLTPSIRTWMLSGDDEDD